MDEKKTLAESYRKMYDGMISKDIALLDEVLDEFFVLVHMTGMRQSKKEFMQYVKQGTLNYFSAEHDNIEVEITGENAMLTGQSLVEAAVFGGGKSMWHLQQKLSLKKRDGIWYITRSVASTYR
jgi:ketosteroid isomerase-like protein